MAKKDSTELVEAAALESAETSPAGWWKACARGARAGNASRVASPQFPIIFRRPINFINRHVDAERGAGVAGISLDGIFFAAGAS